MVTVAILSMSYVPWRPIARWYDVETGERAAVALEGRLNRYWSRRRGQYRQLARYELAPVTTTRLRSPPARSSRGTSR